MNRLNSRHQRLLPTVAWQAAAVLVFGARLLAQETAPDNAASRPNVVIILADDMGYGDVSCYGNRRFETPHIDQLAREGLRFTDFHSSGAVCSPTRAGLLTGRYQQRAGIPGVIFADAKQNRHHGLHAHEVTFAELLQHGGYATAIVGKWHLGYERRFNPTQHGFGEFRGYISGNVDYISHIDRMGVADWWHRGELAAEEGYTTHLITQHAIRFIEANRDRPFCLYVAHEAPHAPYQAPGDRPVRAVGRGHIPQAARKDVGRAYQEMIVELDKGVGDVLQALQRLKLDRRTFVFFFSDNGANERGSNGPLRGFKGSVWEGGHRVPAVAWWPGRIEPGAVCHETAISLDLMPTVLALADVEPPPDHRFDGVNLAPLMTAGQALQSRRLFWQHGRQAAVRDDNWKLVLRARKPDVDVGLYDLGQDPAEANNRADEHSQRVTDMRRALAAWEADVAEGGTRQPDRPAPAAHEQSVLNPEEKK